MRPGKLEVRVGAPIPEGATVECPAGAELVLTGAFQDFIRIRGETSITFNSLASNQEFWQVEIERGEFMFDCRAGGAFLISFRDREIRGKKSTIFLQKQGSSEHLIVQSGQVRVGRKGEAYSSVERGVEIFLE